MFSPLYKPGALVYVVYPGEETTYPAIINGVAHNFQVEGPVCKLDEDGVMQYGLRELHHEDGSLIPFLYDTWGKQQFFYSIQFDQEEMEVLGISAPVIMFKTMANPEPQPIPRLNDVIKEYQITGERISF